MSSKCELLHQWFNSLKKFRFPFNEEEIPLNGIYVLFEKGEIAHGTNRIVRIGTHDGDNRLAERLKEHFLKENKDRSIFRKDIGRALLNKEKNDFLEQWEWDLTTRKAKEKYKDLIDFDKQKKIEKKITEYIQNNLFFVVIPDINTKGKRKDVEKRIISTISLCEECKPSDKWLGLLTPNEKLQTKRTYKNCLKIKESGLWLVNELYGEPLSDKDMEELKSILKIEKKP